MTKKKTSKVFLIAIGLMIFCDFLFPEILFQISGRVIYNGIGINKIKISYQNTENADQKEASSNQEGYFTLYCPSGSYKLFLSDSQGYVSKDIGKIITVKNKNVSNVIFYLEKECKISGYVKLVDGTPIENVRIIITNSRGIYSGDTNKEGIYLIGGIREADSTSVKALIPGCESKIISNLPLKEGDVLSNENFVIQKNNSIIGKVKEYSTETFIDRVYIFLKDNSGNQISTYSDKNGSFNIYNLESGKYEIFFFHQYYYSRSFEININKNELKNIVFELKRLSDEDLKNKKFYGEDWDE